MRDDWDGSVDGAGGRTATRAGRRAAALPRNATGARRLAVDATAKDICAAVLCALAVARRRLTDGHLIQPGKLDSLSRSKPTEVAFSPNFCHPRRAPPFGTLRPATTREALAGDVQLEPERCREVSATCIPTYSPRIPSEGRDPARESQGGARSPPEFRLRSSPPPKRRPSSGADNPRVPPPCSATPTPWRCRCAPTRTSSSARTTPP